MNAHHPTGISLKTEKDSAHRDMAEEQNKKKLIQIG